MPLRVKLRTELERISHILDKNTDDVPSKAEKRLNQIGDVYQKIANASENPSIAIFSDVVSASTSLLQGEMDNFEASCQILMNTLDAVAKIHPFVTIAVLAFKTAVTFEITRRANDKRILALHIDMKDLMSIIAMLQQLAENDLGSDGVSIKDRLGNRMESIAKNIEQCAATCDTMQKKRLIVKVFKSISWETKLKTFSDAFAAHRDGLHRELAMHASLRIEQAVAGVTNLNTTLHGTNTKIDMMMLFEQLRSPEERELWKFIQIKGGPEAFLNDDALMDELVKKNKEESSDPFSKTHALQMELKMGVNELIKENDSLFDRKFQAHQVILIEEMESAMTRLGDRIIGALRTNEVQAYERLTDSNLYELWKEMGWKGGVDARSLVMSLREYFAEHYDSVLFDNADVSPQTTSGPVSPGRLFPLSPLSVSTQYPLHSVDSTRMSITLRQDRWALQYISIPRIRPLLEAFDDDSSSFVTIREMNTFTQARPQNWSLPHWMAYWAVGFQMSLRYYYDRILALLSKMAVVSEKVLDSNRALVDRFMGCAPLRVIEAVLAGIRSSHENDYLDEELFARFKRHVDSEEAKMEKTLQILKYCLDAPNTVAMVLGSGRPEKRLLPLLYLMTNMCFRILKAGCKVTLHRKELIDLANSICTIQSAVSSRLSAVKAMCKLQNLDVKTHLSSFAFSMYYYVEFYEEFMESIYYKNDYHYALQDNDVNEEQGNEDQALFYGPLADEVDLETYDVVKEVYHIAGNLPTGYLPNDALWRGSYTSAGVRFSIGVLSLPVSADSGDGRFYGSGFDTLGEFEIVGQRTGNEIAFNKKYALTEGLTSKWRFEGSINTDIDRIEGVFGHGDFLDDDFQHTHVPSGSVLGTFQVDRRPAYYFLCQPSKEEYRSNRSRVLWRFAITAIIYAIRVQARDVPWVFFEQRRDRRRRFIELSVRLDEEAGNWGPLALPEPLSSQDYEELADLQKTCSVSDLRFYRSLANSLLRRQVIHLDNFCDSCHREGLRMTRLVCLDCSVLNEGGSVDTVDLCAECVQAESTIALDGKVHVPSHSLLQIRKSTPNRRVYSLVSDGFKVLSDFSSISSSLSSEGLEHVGDSHVCWRCKQPVTQPFWICISCQDSAIICESCNRKDEANWLSLFSSWDKSRLPSNLKRSIDPKPEPSENMDKTPRHHWSHYLVLCQPVSDAAAPVPSLEERVGNLEQKLFELEDVVRTRDEAMVERLERIERMLGTIVSMMKKPGDTTTIVR